MIVWLVFSRNCRQVVFHHPVGLIFSLTPDIARDQSLVQDLRACTYLV